MYPFKTRKHLRHPALKVFECAGYFEREFVKLVSSEWGDECGESSGQFGEWYLPKPAVGVELILNTVAPVSWAKASSTRGRGYSSCFTLWFSGFRSTQILICPVFFGTTTMPALQLVGPLTLDMTPCASIFKLSNSVLTCPQIEC